MHAHLPPLPWLRAFEAAARHLSFTHAGAELHLTQAAISKQVRLLEHHLREPLFHRKARSLVLTKAGAAYLPKVRDAFERLAASTTEVFGTRNAEVLTVRAAAGFAVNWIAPRLPGFMAAHPQVQLRLVSSVWNEDTGRERYDLDIRYGLGHWPGFRSDPLTWERLEPLCTPGLRDGTPPLTAPADLKHHVMLHVLGYEEGWANWLRAAGVEGLNPGAGLHFDTSLLAFEVAAKGHGVALGRSSMAAHELTLGRLICPFNLSVPVAEAFHLLRPETGLLHRDAALFRDWIIEQAAADPVNRRNRQLIGRDAP